MHVLTEEARWEYDLERMWAPHGGVRRIADLEPAVQTLSTMRVEDAPS